MKNRIFIQFLAVLSLTACAGRSTLRTIQSVEPVSVETPAGTVARLPWQVKVTYSDGKSELRQTVWTNHAADMPQNIQPAAHIL